MGIKTLITGDWRKRRLIQQFRKVERKFGGDVAIRGSYTGNLGDILIGEVIKDNLEENGRKGKLFSGIHEDFSNYNYLILGGGQIIQNDVKRLKSQRRAMMSSKSFSLHGVGISELDEECSEILDYFGKADKVSVRDKESLDNIKNKISINPKLTADPVFSLNSTISNKTETNRIGVNFRPLHEGFFELVANDSQKVEKLQENYRDFCQNYWKKLNDEYEKVEFIPFNIKDSRFAKDLGIDAGKIRRPMELISYINRDISKMVCTRYHSLIISLITDTEVDIISYAPKVENLALRLDLKYRSLDNLDTDPKVSFEEASSRDIKNLEELALKDFDELIGYIDNST